jgi:hypothetical protein
MKKKLLVFIMLALLGVLCLGAFPREVRPGSFTVARAVSATDDTGPDATHATWADVKTIAVDLTSGGTKSSGIEIFRFRGTGSGTANWVVSFAKEANEPEEFAMYGTCTIGTTATGGTSEYWCNAGAITVQQWRYTAVATQGYQYNLGTGAVSNGGIFTVAIDASDYKYAIVRMSKGTTTTIGCDVAGYR